MQWGQTEFEEEEDERPEFTHTSMRYMTLLIEFPLAML